MATIRIELGKPTQSRQRAVAFVVTSGSTRARIPTQIKLNADEISAGGKIKGRKAQLVEDMRRQLCDRLAALSLDLTGQKVDAQYIAQRITSKQDKVEFFAFADDWLRDTPIRGEKNYVTFLRSLEKFLGVRTLYFDFVTFDLLARYEKFLSGKPRAQSLYLGLFRHLYREAMRRYNTDFDTTIQNDPFTRYRVPKQNVHLGVRALTLDELQKIIQYQGTGRAQLARDCFVLSFALLGMNCADLYTAKVIKDETICYNRQKTKDRRADSAYIEVRVQPHIKELVKKYRGSRRVFCFSERYAAEPSLSRAINIGLKIVGKACGIKDLQFYQARHTFATLSRNLLGIAKSDVDEALNHVGAFSLADVYIKKDFRIINENNAKLLGAVFARAHTQ